MRSSPKSAPLSSAECAELRELRRDLVRLRGELAALGPFVPASKAARMLGFNDTRTVLELVRRGFFPGAWKPAANRLHLRVDEIEAYIAERRVEVPA